MDRTFLLKSLKRLGLSQQFTSIVEAYSGTFVVERGVRQGCPISPLLYTINLEPLTCAKQECITGVPVGGASAKLSAYADVILVYCHQSEGHEIFSKCSI